MSEIYKFVPNFEDSKYILRFVGKKDAEELLEIYGDKKNRHIGRLRLQGLLGT